MSNENILSSEDQGRVEWRKRLYFKRDTLNKVTELARETVRTDDTMVVWIVEQFFENREKAVNKYG